MSSNNHKIAVIGMACRFPGANNLDDFWKNLLDGNESIRRFSNDELSKSEFRFNEIKDNPNFVKARGILDNIDKFDAEFFGMTPREASMTDPQHRVWLETAWEAFENAGCDPVNYPGAIGVFSGASINSYLLNNVLRDPVRLENYIRTRSTDSLQIMTGNDAGYIPTKTAFKFNLKGPAINIQTACSTSLVAISEACQNLITFKSDICLAGAVSIMVPQETGYIYEEGAIISPDGYCRPFDAQGKGTVFSNGVGAVVLKRFDDAIRDHDRIYAVVSGWAVNNDGSEKLSYMAPSIDGQAEVIKMAHLSAQVLPEEISYVETHGTGTQLGDPIEIGGLKKAFGTASARKQYCGLGSVKSNIGHTDAASGVASFIKTCLAAYYKRIPGTINFTELNPHIEIENSPFFIQKESKEWTEQRPLIMGVSSFGVGGTNAHVIVEEPLAEKNTDISFPEQASLLLLSARSDNSLTKRKNDLLDYLRGNPDLNINDIMFTLGTGRNHMSHRSYIVADNLDEIISERKLFTSATKDNLITNIAFMFPGQGAQYISMGKDLYKTDPLFRQSLNECFEIVKSETGEDLKTLLFESSNRDDAEKKLADTEITQPALFIIEYALAKVFERLEIKPGYLIGHSIGEFTAACIAGVFDLPTALKIVIKRGQLMQKMHRGKMMAIRANIELLRKINNSSFEIAADNAPELCTISFDSEDNDRVIELLDQNKLQYIPLNTSHAFHSKAFDPILNEFSTFIDQFKLKEPGLPFISCLTGEFITAEQAISGEYWANQLRNTVLFRKGISTITKSEDVVFLEIGPNTHLSSLVRQNNDVENKKAIIATLGKPDDISEPEKILSALGKMYIIGINININLLPNGLSHHKISLPGYPFEKKRHWIDFELSDISDSKPYTDRKLNAINHTEYESSAALPQTVITTKEDVNAAVILNIWKSLTGINEIGPDEDFFEIGGHSLVALQIMTRIKEELNYNISLKTFYDNPTINKLNAIILKDNNISQKSVSEITTSINMTNLPLSANQNRLWIISQLDGLNPAYNIPFTYHFSGNLDINIFRQSINFLFERHFFMFSSFKTRNNQPYCEVFPAHVTIELLDFSDDTPDGARNKIYSFAGEDSRKVFNLETGPLYRLYLLKQDSSNIFFHGTISHLIFDGWSWSVFIRELNKIYNSLRLKKEADLEDVKIHYLDYARGLSAGITKFQEEKLTKFWIQNLSGCPPRLNFPYDYPRKDIQTGFGEKEIIEISSQVTIKLKETSKKQHSTLFATVFSALGVLFSRYSGEDDICIGTHVANRSQTGLEKIFGMFVNTVPVRLIINGNTKFSDFIDYTKNALLDAIEHQDLPFEKIVAALNPERTSNVNPFFQVSVVWLYNAPLPLELSGLKGEYVTIKEGISPFDITFYLWEKDDHIEGEIEYNTDILSQNNIIRLRDNFINLLQTLIENPGRSIADISVFSEGDEQMLAKFNQTEAEVPDIMIQNYLEKQSELVPLKTAFISNGRELTYRELNNQSNQFANYLLSRGVVPGDVVGICLERSLDMVISVLGVLKSGCCYLPMDPSFPDDRIRYMYEDSGAKTLISQSSLKEKFSQFNSDTIILTDTDKKKISEFKTDKPQLNLSSGSLAYIIYTSGSTGKPKGVKVHHKAVVNFIESMSRVPGIKEDDNLLAVITLSFDISVFELLLPLRKGATVIIANAKDTTDGKVLTDLIEKHNITILQATPSFWHVLLTSGWKGKKNLRALCGGEPLTKNLAHQILPKVQELWNCYGPTETTVWSTCYRITDADAPILIGKPINNTIIHILDKNNKKLPVGVTGEVCIGGSGVTKGYHNRPELTAEKFIPVENGQIFYKTGDQGRFLMDGNIELYGRIDNQIKLRGFRIEPGEIENLLSQLSGIKEAVVKVHKFEENDQRLVAFLNIDQGYKLTREEITGFLSMHLPAYMIPAFFQTYGGFPRLPNGKINKKALKLELDESFVVKKAEADPITSTQKTLIEIWEDILKTRGITVTDNFFNIGGNSLLAISAFSKIKSVFNVGLSLRNFFDSPRIKDLADAIDLSTYRDNMVNPPEKTKEKAIGIINGEI